MSASAARAVPVYPQLVPNWIDGGAVVGRATPLPIIDPSTGGRVGELGAASEADVALAVDAARRRFDEGAWSRAPTAARQAVLARAAAALRDDAESLARLDTLCTGLTLYGSTLRQVEVAAGWLEYFAARIGSVAGDVFRHVPGATTLVVQEPRGVAALFAPWNVPLGLAMVKVAAALATGNSVVLKPSEKTPLAILRAVALLEAAGLPPGALNVVNGPGALTGAALAAHPGVDCVSFTGGGAGGLAVARAAAERHAPCLLELGGKSALLVFADADLDAAADAAIRGGFGNNGQACLASSRVLVERTVATEFTERLVARAAALRIGDPFDRATDLGPLADAAQRDRVLAYAARVRASGDELLLGGGPCAELGTGFFVHPVVARVRDPAHPAAQDEIFGPFVTLLEFADEEAAWRIANGTRYGLVAYAWTRDYARALRAARRLQAGTVLLNTPMVRERNAPFGGARDSGTGAEGGEWSLRFYTQEKTIVMAETGPGVRP